MSVILLSIKPQYVELILTRKKRFEFRRLLPKNEFDKIVIYESSPTMRVVAECDVDKVLTNTPEKIWKQTQKFAGVSREHFDKYFEGKAYANAIKIKNVRVYDVAKSLTDFGIKRAPQSFCYLKK